MQRKLAIFDFGETIMEDSKKETTTQKGLSKLFPNNEFPLELKEIKKLQGKYNFWIAMAAAINEKDVTKDEIIEAILSGKTLIKGMDTVLRTLAKDHDIIIISGSHTGKIKAFLTKYDLLDCIQEIFGRPSIITDNGKLLFSPIPEQWGGPCKTTGKHE